MRWSSIGFSGTSLSRSRPEPAGNELDVVALFGKVTLFLGDVVRERKDGVVDFNTSRLERHRGSLTASAAVSSSGQKKSVTRYQSVRRDRGGSTSIRIGFAAEHADHPQSPSVDDVVATAAIVLAQSQHLS